MKPEEKEWVEEVKRVQSESIQPDSVRVRLISIIERQERVLGHLKKCFVKILNVDSQEFRDSIIKQILSEIEEMER